MRTAEEIRERYIHIAELNDIDKAEIEVAIQITQTEAWNEALDTTIRHLQKVTTRGDILYTVSKLKR